MGSTEIRWSLGCDWRVKWQWGHQTQKITKISLEFFGLFIFQIKYGNLVMLPRCGCFTVLFVKIFCNLWCRGERNKNNLKKVFRTTLRAAQDTHLPAVGVVLLYVAYEYGCCALCCVWVLHIHGHSAMANLITWSFILQCKKQAERKCVSSAPFQLTRLFTLKIYVQICEFSIPFSTNSTAAQWSHGHHHHHDQMGRSPLAHAKKGQFILGLFNSSNVCSIEFSIYAHFMRVESTDFNEDI